MEETLEYWQKCLAEFQEAAEAELEQDFVNDDMLILLKKEIEHCTNKVNELSND